MKFNQDVIAAFKEAENVLWACGDGSPSPDSNVLWEYGIYRLGDKEVLAFGFSWFEGKLHRSAKVQGGIVTDHYVIYPAGGRYRSAQVDPVSMQPIVLYETVTSVYEPKIDAATGEVLQNNFYATVYDLPLPYRKSLAATEFPFLYSIYCYADKPYGQCVEFQAEDLKSWISKNGLVYRMLPGISEM